MLCLLLMSEEETKEEENHLKQNGEDEMQQPWSHFFVQYCTTLRGGSVLWQKYRSSHQCCTAPLRRTGTKLFTRNQTIYKWCRRPHEELAFGSEEAPNRTKPEAEERISRQDPLSQQLCAEHAGPRSPACVEKLPACFWEFQPLWRCKSCFSSPTKTSFFGCDFQKARTSLTASINISVCCLNAYFEVMAEATIDNKLSKNTFAALKWRMAFRVTRVLGAASRSVSAAQQWSSPPTHSALQEENNSFGSRHVQDHPAPLKDQPLGTVNPHLAK